MVDSPSNEPRGSSPTGTQRILVFEQNGSAVSKIQGIKRYGESRFLLEIYSLDVFLPPILDDTREYLPKEIQADLVLDFLKHPDLSYDLATKCSNGNIPAVASGKKLRVKGVLTPPT